jgi:hypothetical protein
MNLRLSDHRIRETCRALLYKSGQVSGRALVAELKRRFGAVGKTERVFAIWREEVRAAAVPADVAQLQRQLAQAQAQAAQNLQRAELAELREQKHQETWAMEVDRLRMELRRLRGQ